MPIRNHHLFAAVPIVLYVCGGFCSQARAADPCDLSLLPRELQTELAKTYPDSQLERLENLSEYYRQSWLKEHPNDCPGIAIGHFESKSELSYALFLVPRPDRERPGASIVVFSRIRPTARFVSHLVFRWNDGNFCIPSDLVISKVAAGKYGGPKVLIGLDGVLYEAMEKASSLYYWKNGRYQGLSISD
jgi:hypothetical protein